MDTQNFNSFLNTLHMKTFESSIQTIDSGTWVDVFPGVFMLIEAQLASLLHGCTSASHSVTSNESLQIRIYKSYS